MRVMVLGFAEETSETGAPPSARDFAAMDRFVEELTAAGVLVAGAGLKPTKQSKRVRLDGPRRVVLDGPFTETKEVVAGFQIWEVKDMDEALEWAMRSPRLPSCPGIIEIRPFLEAADLADLLSPEELATPREGERGRLGVA